MATTALRAKKTRTTKYLVIAVAATCVLLLAGTVLFQLRSVFNAHDRAVKRDAPSPALLTTIKPAGSIPTLRAATTRSPRDAAAWSRLGDATLIANDLPGAIDAYKQAVALDDTRWQDWSALGEAYVQTEQSQGGHMPVLADQAFDHALRLHPTDMRSLFYKTMEKDFLGRHDEAINSWMAMLGQVPMGSKADGAIRGAIIASVGRHAIIVRDRLSAATKAQEALKARAAPKAGA